MYETWVKILGLPFFCGTKAFSRNLGMHASGGFVVVDEDTANCHKLQWARVLVKTRGPYFLSSLWCVVGDLCFPFLFGGNFLLGCRWWCSAK